METEVVALRDLLGTAVPAMLVAAVIGDLIHMFSPVIADDLCYLVAVRD